MRFSLNKNIIFIIIIIILIIARFKFSFIKYVISFFKGLLELSHLQQICFYSKLEYLISCLSGTKMPLRSLNRVILRLLFYFYIHALIIAFVYEPSILGTSMPSNFEDKRPFYLNALILIHSG